MTRWYDASEGVVESANIAMAEIADSVSAPDDRVVRIREVWEPVANALRDSVREDLGTNWPDEAALADSLGADFVGQTSDSGRIVSWGEDRGAYRPFVIHPSAG